MGTLKGQKVAVIGGTSGVGLQVLFQAVMLGASGMGVSRSEENVERASTRAKEKGLADRLSFRQADGEDEAQLRLAFADFAPLDHLVVSVLDRSKNALGPYRQLRTAGLKRGLHKFWAHCASIDASDGLLREGGSITLISGSDDRKAWPGVVSHAVVGGALNALVRTLAIELAPTRINIVCPGPTMDAEYDRSTALTAGRRYRLGVDVSPFSEPG